MNERSVDDEQSLLKRIVVALEQKSRRYEKRFTRIARVSPGDPVRGANLIDRFRETRRDN
jgi:hypothetical protein